MENKILEAFEAGKKIKHVKWANDEWIMKIGDNRTMSQYSESKPQIPLDKYPELWEIVQEDVEPEAPTQPKTSMFIGAIQQAIDLLKKNGYEIYQITKTKL